MNEVEVQEWIKCNECGNETDADLHDCACEECGSCDWSDPYPEKT
jgi:Zn finger protein HypA/HybF involved in hydrogenase expression